MKCVEPARDDGEPRPAATTSILRSCVGIVSPVHHCAASRHARPSRSESARARPRRVRSPCSPAILRGSFGHEADLVAAEVGEHLRAEPELAQRLVAGPPAGGRVGRAAAGARASRARAERRSARRGCRRARRSPAVSIARMRLAQVARRRRRGRANMSRDGRRPTWTRQSAARRRRRPLHEREKLPVLDVDLVVRARARLGPGAVEAEAQRFRSRGGARALGLEPVLDEVRDGQDARARASPRRARGRASAPSCRPRS